MYFCFKQKKKKWQKEQQEKKTISVYKMKPSEQIAKGRSYSIGLPWHLIHHNNPHCLMDTGLVLWNEFAGSLGKKRLIVKCMPS